MIEDPSELERERLRADRYKSWTSVALALVGAMVASLVLYGQFHDQRSREVLDLLRLQQATERQQVILELLDQRLRDIERRLERLEQGERRPSGMLTPPRLRLLSRTAEADAPAKTGLRNEIPDSVMTRRGFSPLLREYILPAIYSLLGLIFLASATVALATANRGRKDTALEMTKTLMSFFIGVATGQV